MTLKKNNPKDKQRAYSQKWRDAHPEAKRADSARWRAANPDKVKELARRVTSERNRAFHLRHAFDLSVEEYDRMLVAQNGVCAICLQPCRTGRSLAVDHDHATDRVRGLLCSNCNRGIGLLGDDAARVRAAASYLARGHDV